MESEVKPDRPTGAALYADLMEDIKLRLSHLRTTMLDMSADETDVNNLYEAEHCYLQIRFICELIALAALGANEKFGITSKLLKSWHAGNIFGALSKINPHCFPHPVIITRDNTGIHIRIDETESLDIKALIKIYDRCGEKLHRGVLKHALNQRERIYDMTEVNEWARSIIALLKSHASLIPHGNQVLLVQLNGTEGRVTVATAEGINGNAFAVVS